jgi:hypothetical protein
MIVRWILNIRMLYSPFRSHFSEPLDRCNG